MPLLGVLLAGLLLGRPPASSARRFINSYAGPYTAYVIAFPQCEASAWDGSSQVDFKVLSHYNPVRPREPQTFQGNITLSRLFSDESWLRVTVASRSNNQWKRNAFVFNFPVGGCSAYRGNMPVLYEALMHTNASTAEPCVVPAGVYRTDKRVRLHIAFPNVPIMPYGQWLYQTTLGRPGRALPFVCWQAEARTVPKM